MTYVPDRSDEPIIAIRRMFEHMLGVSNATGTVRFSGNPSVGDSITISDGVNEETYSFVSSVSEDTDVLIGSVDEDTLINLEAAINDQTPDVSVVDPKPGILAFFDTDEESSSPGDGTPVLYLINLYPGSAGNVSITKVDSGGNIFVTGMTNGSDALTLSELLS